MEILNVLNTLTLKQIFWKTKPFFEKLERRFRSFFFQKTAISEVNVETNRMATKKWTYHKEWSFAGNYFIFFKILLQFKNLLQRVNLMYQRPKFQYEYILKFL